MQEYVVLDGRILVAVIKDRDGTSITADLYRNLDDYRAGAVMERAAKLVSSKDA